MNEPTSQPALARPVAFSDETFADARARAIAERRWLVVDVADEADPICWAAAYTTWRDPELVAWLEAYAIAIRVEVRADAKQSKRRARGLVAAGRDAEAAAVADAALRFEDSAAMRAALR